MTLHLPVLKLGVLLPPQQGLEDKFGGMPWGFPRERWPHCRHCKAPMSFLAQLSHHSKRLNLSKSGRILLAFQCDGDKECPHWEGGAGANAVLFAESGELGGGMTPPHHPGMAIYTEARVVHWKERSRIRSTETTLTGGKPHWFQTEEDPPPPWRFVMQLFSEYSFSGKPPTANEAGCIVRRQGRGGKWVDEKPSEVKPGAPRVLWATKSGYTCDPLIFGLESLIYFFVNTDEAKPKGLMFSQST